MPSNSRYSCRRGRNEKNESRTGFEYLKATFCEHLTHTTFSRKVGFREGASCPATKPLVLARSDDLPALSQGRRFETFRMQATIFQRLTSGLWLLKLHILNRVVPVLCVQESLMWTEEGSKNTFDYRRRKLPRCSSFMSPDTFKKAKAAVIRVGTARGFVVKGPKDDPVVITASHCLRRLPRVDRSESRGIYPNLIGLLNHKPTIWTECLFVDPIADIAVLGSVDAQALPEEADAYDSLFQPIKPIPIGPMEENTKAWLLSLKGEWFECEAQYEKRADSALFICNTGRNRSKVACQVHLFFRIVAKQSVLLQPVVRLINAKMNTESKVRD